MNVDWLLSLLRFDFKQASSKLTEKLVGLGFRLLEIDFARDVVFGWIEGYLNAGVCSRCFNYLGDAKEVPDYVICSNCGEKVYVIKVTPMRVYLAMSNNVDLFEIIPEQIRLQPIKWINPGLKDAILRAYDSITPEMLLDPFMAWLHDKRPDILYTLLLHPFRSTKMPYYIYVLYDLIFDRLTEREVFELCKKLGLGTCSKDLLIDVIKSALKDYVREHSVLLKVLIDDKFPRTDEEKEDFEWVLQRFEAGDRKELFKKVAEEFEVECNKEAIFTAIDTNIQKNLKYLHNTVENILIKSREIIERM